MHMEPGIVSTFTKSPPVSSETIPVAKPTEPNFYLREDKHFLKNWVRRGDWVEDRARFQVYLDLAIDRGNAEHIAECITERDWLEEAVKWQARRSSYSPYYHPLTDMEVLTSMIGERMDKESLDEEEFNMLVATLEAVTKVELPAWNVHTAELNREIAEDAAMREAYYLERIYDGEDLYSVPTKPSPKSSEATNSSAETAVSANMEPINEDDKNLYSVPEKASSTAVTAGDVGVSVGTTTVPKESSSASTANSAETAVTAGIVSVASVSSGMTAPSDTQPKIETNDHDTETDGAIRGRTISRESSPQRRSGTAGRKSRGNAKNAMEHD